MHIAISLYAKKLLTSSCLFLMMFLCLWLWGQKVQAQQEGDEERDTLDYGNPHLIVLSPEYKTYKLAKQVFFLEDKEKTLIVDEVEKPNYQHRFEPYPKKTINFGYTTSAFWLKFQVKNLQPEEAWFLEISYPLLDHIEFYSQKPDSTWAMIKLGDMQSFGEREINYRNFIIPLHQDDTLTRTYFVKAYTKGALQVPMEIIKARDFYKQNATSELLYGLFYGIMIVMIFYNTVLYFALNDSNYLYYVLSILGSTLFIATITGHIFQHIFPNQVNVAMNMINMSMALFIIGSSLFARNFLETRRSSKLFHRTFNVTLVVGFIMFALIFGVDYNIMIRAFTVITILCCVVLIAAGVYMLYRGVRSAKYFVMAWTFYVLGLVSLGLKTIGLFPNNFVTSHGAEVGSVLEVILLALALADKYALMRTERKKVQDQLLAQQQQENIRLEKKVKERTAEIEQQKEEIKAQRDYLEEVYNELANKNEEINSKNNEIESKNKFLEKAKEEIEKAYDIIQESTRSITDSIRYAQTIQLAILPSTNDLQKSFKDYFIIFKPKDIVSGDFYWVSKVKDFTFFAVVDCTGHGVPGAFMSMVGVNTLNEIVSHRRIFEPSMILDSLHANIQLALHQEDKSNDDGMDICLCRLEYEHGQPKVMFAGAKRPLFFVKKDEPTLFAVKGDRKSIGGLQKKQADFTNQELVLEAGSRLYLMTDGYVDQCNPNHDKIGIDRLANLIQTQHEVTLMKQRQAIEHFLTTFQEDFPQRDDITIMAVEI